MVDLTPTCNLIGWFVDSVSEENQELYKEDIDWEDEDTIVSGLTCLFIVGIEDPVRSEVRQAYKEYS